MTNNNNDYDKRTKRILDLSDRILDKVTSAIDEVDRCIIKTKEKSKTVKYDDELKKPVYEVYDEKEKLEVIDAIVDTGSLKQIVATLKDIRDIHVGFSEGENKGEASESGVILIAPIEQTEEVS